jgi:hypothetical protein
MGVCEVCGNNYDKAFEVVSSEGVGRSPQWHRDARHACSATRRASSWSRDPKR